MKIGPGAGLAPRLSLCMTVKNEAQLIERAIDSVRAAVDEIVVVDTGSTDDTREIAARCGARVYEHAWDGRLGPPRNASLRLAHGRWVLVLDGDETIAQRDTAALRELIADPQAVAYWFMVHNYTRSFDLLCDWHPNRGGYPEEEEFSQCPGHSRFPVLRLFRREDSVRYEEGISSHISPVESLRALGSFRNADVVIHHFQYRKGGEAFIARKQRERLADEQQHLEHRPDDGLAHLNVGRTLFALGDDEPALVHLDRAVELSDDPRALISRAIARFETGAFDGAAADAADAARYSAQSADAWCILGMAEHARERYAAAAEALRTALVLRPLHPLALNSFGVLLMDRGDVAGAADYFRRALASLPDFPAARANLADVLARAHLHDADQSLGVQIGDKCDDVLSGRARSSRRTRQPAPWRAHRSYVSRQALPRCDCRLRRAQKNRRWRDRAT